MVSLVLVTPIPATIGTCFKFASSRAFRAVWISDVRSTELCKKDCWLLRNRLEEKVLTNKVWCFAHSSRNYGNCSSLRCDFWKISLERNGLDVLQIPYIVYVLRRKRDLSFC